MIKHLQMWLDRGYHLFPIVMGQKVPLIQGWEAKASKDPEVILGWTKEFPNCNWAVACGPSGLLVLDVDPRNGGEDSFVSLDLELCLPTTLEINTPSGGKHLYMSGSSRSKTGFRPGLDIKSQGGYVLLPPSVIEGKPYAATDSSLPAASAPENLVALIGQRKQVTLDSDSGVCNDNPSDIARAIQYLKNRAPAIEKQSGDIHTLKTALALRDFGLTKETAFDLLSDWNETCIPPWSPEDLAKKVVNAFEYAQFPAGNASVEATPFTPVRKSGSFVQCNDLWSMNPPREWVAEGWIPKGSACPTLLSGDGGTGKSLAALQLCMAVAAGKDWFGIRTNKMPTIYVGCEDDEAELSRRLSAIKAADPEWAIGNPPVQCYLMSRSGEDGVLVKEGIGNDLVKGPFFGILDTAVMDLGKGPKLIVLDTVADIFAGNENSRPMVNGFIKHEIGNFAKKHDLTVILIAHPAKAQGSEFSGSTAWSNAVRNRIFLSPKDKSNPTYKIMKNAKANYSPTGKEILLKWDSGILKTVDGEECSAVWDSAVLEVITSAAESGSPYTSTHHGLNRFIGKVKIVTTNDMILTKDEILASVDRLCAAKLIEIRKGGGHKNGIFPIKDTVSADGAADSHRMYNENTDSSEVE